MVQTGMNTDNYIYSFGQALQVQTPSIFDFFESDDYREAQHATKQKILVISVITFCVILVTSLIYITFKTDDSSSNSNRFLYIMSNLKIVKKGRRLISKYCC